MKRICLNSMKTWVMLLAILAPMKVYAASPAVFFSDMTDAPTTGFNGSATQGAAVSIWGVDFGAARGTSTVTVCGVTLNQDSDFMEWGATTNPYVARGMQRITFFLKSTMTAGASTIQVTTGSGQSNTVPFYCRPLGSNHIYFLATNGSDSNNGTSTSTPWASPSKVRNLQAGDIAYFRAGTYATIDNYNDVIDFWSNNHGNGAANKSISIASYPGEVAQLGDNSSEASIGHHGTVLDIWTYWTFSKFNFRSMYQATWTPDGQDDHIRFVGNDGRTGYGQPGDTSAKTIFSFYAGRGGQSYLSFYGNYAHHCGTDTDSQTPQGTGYPLYIEGSMPGTNCTGYPNCGHHTNIDIGWNEFAFCKSGRGMQIYGHQVFDQVDMVYIHDNWVHDNGMTGAILGGGDGSGGTYFYQFVKNIYFYNNILYNNGDPNYLPGGYPCLLMGGENWGGTHGNWFIYNNICYHSSGGEVFVSLSSPPDKMPPDLIVLKNNIFYALPGQPYYFGDTGSYYTGSNNLYYGNGSGVQPWETNSLDNTDPKFLASNPMGMGIADFALQSTSPAIDAGTSSVNPIVTKDFMGLPRPQGSSYDIGAFEYDRGSPPPKAPSVPTGVGVN